MPPAYTVTPRAASPLAKDCVFVVRVLRKSLYLRDRAQATRASMAGGGESQLGPRIGVLIVHGIGEQNRFDTAAALTRSLAITLKARCHSISVVDRTGALSSAELACPSEDSNNC